MADKPNEMTFEEFVAYAAAVFAAPKGPIITDPQGNKRNSHDIRWGQCFFNLLYEVRPDLSEQIRGSALDPFHVDAKMAETLKWCEQNW